MIAANATRRPAWFWAPVGVAQASTCRESESESGVDTVTVDTVLPTAVIESSGGCTVTLRGVDRRLPTRACTRPVPAALPPVLPAALSPPREIAPLRGTPGRAAPPE